MDLLITEGLVSSIVVLITFASRCVPSPARTRLRSMHIARCLEHLPKTAWQAEAFAQESPSFDKKPWSSLNTCLSQTILRSGYVRD